MRDLDAINPVGMRPSRFIGVCACLPFLMSLVSVPLAYGAAPQIPLTQNPVVHLVLLVLSTALILACLSLALHWGWKIRYYGISLLFGASISLIAVVPLLALMVYGSAAPWLKFSVLAFYVITHIVWCRRFLAIYKGIFGNEILRKVLYEEESDAVYYMRSADQYLLDKYYKFSQMPQDRYFAIFIVLALALVPIVDTVRELTGIPFPYAFLIVGMVPVSWMSFGFAFRAYLICYSYPAKIRQLTGKEVLVDIASKHKGFKQQTSLASGLREV